MAKEKNTCEEEVGCCLSEVEEAEAVLTGPIPLGIPGGKLGGGFESSPIKPPCPWGEELQRGSWSAAKIPLPGPAGPDAGWGIRKVEVWAMLIPALHKRERERDGIMKKKIEGYIRKCRTIRTLAYRLLCRKSYKKRKQKQNGASVGLVLQPTKIL